jgi:hypothetical protein
MKKGPEELLLDNVLEYARLFRYRRAHFRPARTVRNDGSVRYLTPVQADGKGFPDLVLAREATPARQGRIIYAELKGGKYRKLEPEQEVWRDVLVGAGAEWYCWRPGDEDEILAILQRD